MLLRAMVMLYSRHASPILLSRVTVALQVIDRIGVLNVDVPHEQRHITGYKDTNNAEIQILTWLKSLLRAERSGKTTTE